MTEFAELDKNREDLQKKANVARAQRDKLNEEARRWANRRDEENAKVRELVNTANEHRKKRDEYNEAVQRHKKTRDEAMAESDAAKEALETLKRERMPKGGRPVHAIRRDIERLEFEQMTKVLTPAKERGLIEKLQALMSELKQKEDVYKADPELKEALDKFEAARERAEKAHQKVSETAEKAQAEHEQMVKLFGQSDRIRKEADQLQEKFVGAKVEADRVHKEYIELVNRIHELEKTISDQRVDSTGKSIAERREVAQDRADDIFERFKRGEKLSTEDLMTLQKAGLL
ncbi:MAG: phosphoserine phosphatase [Euryarchaeota archaeon]|nr:phosphoserine phosphatase [Euryarchaeota archaeon]